MKKVEPGEIKLYIEDNYTAEEIKQLIALESGNILASSSFAIPITKERLRKLLYLRTILLENNIIIGDSTTFSFITDEELDGLISLLEKNFVISNTSKINKIDVVIWKILTGQIFKVTDFYADIDKSKKSEVKTIGIIYCDKDLLEYFLNYLVNITETFTIKPNRYYKILKWFAINNYFTKYKEFYLSKSFEIVYNIEALCLLVCPDFIMTRIFSVIKYFILIQSPEDNMFRSILSFRSKDYFKQNISRSDRRKILQQIDYLCSAHPSNYIPRVDNKYKPYIMALDKRLHPSDYINIFPKAYQFFVSHRNESNNKLIDVSSSDISKLYKQNDFSVIQIASTVFDNFSTITFVKRFDSFARRAEKEGKESYLLDMLIDADLSFFDLDWLERMYVVKLNKLRAKEKDNTFFTKPSANIDFIECVLDIIKIKKESRRLNQDIDPCNNNKA